MTLDLNRILYYADRQGQMTETIQRKVVHIVDAIVAGDGEGPMRPNPRPCNLLAGGYNPVAVDAILATIIGFDPRKVPLIDRAFAIRDWPLVDFTADCVAANSDDRRFEGLRIGTPFPDFSFQPPAAWKGHVEAGIPGAAASTSGTR
jgi:hypothetical protein